MEFNRRGAIIVLSGGIDSAVVAKLNVFQVEYLSFFCDNFSFCCIINNIASKKGAIRCERKTDIL